MADGRPSAALYEALVEGSQEFICTFDAAGVIDFANAAGEALLGWTRDELIGSNVADLLHPEDLERALIGLAASADLGAPGGTSSFRVRRADGSYVDVDLAVGDVGLELDDGPRVAVFCREADYQHAIDGVLQYLLAGGTSAAEALAPVLDVFAWRPNGSNIAIAWFDREEGHGVVSTGLPIELTGAEDDPGEPWALARATGKGVSVPMPVELDPARTSLVEGSRLGGVWVEPVEDIGAGVAALITVWTSDAGRPVNGHAYGMSVAKRFTELILRWRHQIRRLEDAAYRDPLTGLGNRAVFFDVLAEERPPGALLYCDLDRFKPVNDRYGHAAGDEVLRRVATRLRSCVRAEDLVARIGGDEFVVLCRDATDEQADALAERITAAFDEPFEVAGVEVELGISIGVALALDGATEDTLDAADRALYEHKAQRRSA